MAGGLNIQKALALRDSKALKAAAVEAETRNCEPWVIRELYRLYYEALEREQAAARRASGVRP
jgi:hypothetical protein